MKRVIDVEIMQVRFVFTGPGQFVLVNDIPHFFKEWISRFFILVFIIVQYAVLIHVDNSADHKFQVVFEIHDIGSVDKKTVGPSRLIE